MAIKSEYKIMDWALLRLPAFSISHYLQMLEEPAKTKEHLCQFFTDPFARDALAYMAPDYWRRVSAKLDSSTIDSNDVATLLRYANRLCFRATPFGMSATVSSLRMQPGNLPVIQERAAIRLEIELDELATMALLQSEEAQTLPHEGDWIANDTIYPSAGLLRFVKLNSSSADNSANAAILSSVEINPYLMCALEFAAVPRSSKQIAGHIITTFAHDELTSAEVEGFISQLITQQLLTKDHLFCLTDKQTANTAINTKHPGKLAAIHQISKQMTYGCNDIPANIAAIKTILGPYSEKLPAVGVLRINAWRDLPDEAGIPPATLRNIEAVIHTVAAMTRPRLDVFEAMLGKWDARYGDADLPLMLVVDEANGLYADTSRNGTAIIRDLPMRLTTSKQKLSLLREVLTNNYHPETNEITLSQREIQQFIAKSVESVPASSTGWFRFLQSDDHSQILIAMTGFGAWPAGRLLGRFCHGDPRLHQMLLQTAKEGESDSTIVAELTYHPRGRIANVCRRPVLSSYELTIRTGAAPGTVKLALADLLVCRVGNKLRLRSISLAKWVELRMSAAHNHELRSNLKLYRFLVDLVGQDNPSLGEIFPRSYLPDLVCAPRIKLGPVIVAPASWRLTTPVLVAFRAAASDSDLIETTNQLRKRFNLPEYVIHADGDNELLLHLSNPICLRELQAIAKSRSEFILTEYAPPGFSPSVNGIDGKYNHECLVTCTNHAAPVQTNLAHRAAIMPRAEGNHAETYGPGSQWVYFTIAVQPVFQDAVLMRAWARLITPLRAAGDVTSAFFVRYTDQQGPHLRIRLCVRTHQQQGSVLLACQQWLASETQFGECIDACFQTYAPEWNRYGGVAAMTHVHELFSASSDMVISLLALPADVSCAALWTIDQMLTLAGMTTLEQKRDFARRHASGFNKEYGFTADIRRQTADIARKNGDLNSHNSQFLSVAAVSNAITEFRHAITNLIVLATATELCKPLQAILSSVLHMHLNRFFSTDPRAQEAVFWDIARRIYEREISR